MNDETWTCPGCSRVAPLRERICPNCRTTQVRPRSSAILPKVPPAPAPGPAAPAPAAPPRPVTFPFIIPDARYNLPVEGGGATWTSGSLVATEGGLSLINEKDGLDPAQASSWTLPPRAQRLAPHSFHVPKGLVVRIVHDMKVGQFLEIEGQRLPLRFSVQGWKDLDAVCDALGIPHQP